MKKAVKAEIFDREESEDSEGFLDEISHNYKAIAEVEGQSSAPSEPKRENAGQSELDDALLESLTIKEEKENLIAPFTYFTTKAFSLHSPPHLVEENPSPTLTLPEAKAILSLMRSLPSVDAKVQVASKVIWPAIDALNDTGQINEMVKTLTTVMETEIINTPDEAPWYGFPHYDINASAETKKNAALRGRNILVKAANLEQLRNAIYQMGSAAFAWVADYCSSQAERETIWDTLRTWLNSLEAEQP